MDQLETNSTVLEPNKMPLYLRIKQKIHEDIRRSGIRSGERYPAIQKLSSHYKVSPVTINRAVASLQAEGVLSVKRGSGIYINGNKDSASSTCAGLLLGCEAYCKHPYFTHMIHGMRRQLDKYSMELGVFHLRRGLRLDQAESFVRRLVERGIVSSMILEGLYATTHEHQWLASHGVAAVFVGRYEDPEICSVEIFTEDDRRDMLDFLTGLGHYRIGMYLPIHHTAPEVDETDPQQEEHLGQIPPWRTWNRIWKEYVSKGLIDGNPNLLPAINTSLPQAADLVCKWYLGLDPRPTALILPEETVAVAVVEQLRNSGISVPEDVSVFGKGSIEAADELTFWEMPMERAGAAIATMIKNQLDGNDEASRKEQIYGRLRRGKTVRINKEIT